jgi:hypothetical protein
MEPVAQLLFNLLIADRVYAERCRMPPASSLAGRFSLPLNLRAALIANPRRESVDGPSTSTHS